MNKKFGLNISLKLVCFFLFLLFCCEKDSINKIEVIKPSKEWDLEQIKASGTLRA